MNLGYSSGQAAGTIDLTVVDMASVVNSDVSGDSTRYMPVVYSVAGISLPIEYSRAAAHFVKES